MRYASIRKMDTTNGDGLTVSIFFQGCNHHCKGCWNESTWDFNGGRKLTEDVIIKIINYAKQPYIKGVSILGGEPFQQDSLQLLSLLKRLKTNVNKSIWLWTGYTYNTIPSEYRECLSYIDVLVDGRFILEKRDLTLQYRGSSNQRVIDVKETLKQDKIILYKNLK